MALWFKITVRNVSLIVKAAHHKFYSLFCEYSCPAGSFIGEAQENKIKVMLHACSQEGVRALLLQGIRVSYCALGRVSGSKDMGLQLQRHCRPGQRSFHFISQLVMSCMCAGQNRTLLPT
ncbi:hypothetical protein DUNSADRAFT_8943 [Dunaliella salina]|uniref:Encoded protein n=1 Tax=Dunaliella salina TaxID=3046 RepID=A0ABQ7GIK0_DUNSA|nr:hypothetical protein DUNSADRAFT_8943 [Dunaliella salina]|eukprot:KAF5834413.1 hypothetical protein DUNSADRAFT_8943 [Dunaliella salina]